MRVPFDQVLKEISISVFFYKFLEEKEKMMVNLRVYASETKAKKIPNALVLEKQQILTKFETFSDLKNRSHSKDRYFRQKVLNLK